jgi:hypothetical protein
MSQADLYEGSNRTPDKCCYMRLMLHKNVDTHGILIEDQ